METSIQQHHHVRQMLLTCFHIFNNTTNPSSFLPISPRNTHTRPVKLQSTTSSHVHPIPITLSHTSKKKESKSRSSNPLYYCTRACERALLPGGPPATVVEVSVRAWNVAPFSDPVARARRHPTLILLSAATVAAATAVWLFSSCAAAAAESSAQGRL